MKPPHYECDADAVIEMQSMDVGIEEILQYCHALMTEKELRGLIRGLENVIGKFEVGTIGENDVAVPKTELASVGEAGG